MKYCYHLLSLMLLLALTMFSPPAASALEPLTIKPEGSTYYICPYMEILEDQDKALGFDEIVREKYSSRFIQNTKNFISLGLSKSAFWLRFKLVVDDTPYSETTITNQHTDWFLKVGNPCLDHIDLYIPVDQDIQNKGYIIKRTGAMRPSDTQEIKYRSFFFTLPANTKHDTFFYIRIESTSSLNTHIEILSDMAFQQNTIKDNIGFGILYGIIISMALFNLFLFVSLRDVTYIYYVLHILSDVLYKIVLYGHIRIFSNQLHDIERHLLFLFLAGSVFWAGAFSKAFLSTKTNTPGLDKIFSLLMLFAVVIAGIGLLGFHFQANIMSHALGPLSVFISILSGVICIRSGFHPARYYLLAWSVFLLGIILFTSRGFGILASNFITEYTLTIGAALGAILLSFALADRIRILQIELKELTANLEHKVVERTQKLKNAQEELIEKAHKAGMADIATDILHNIGNILNSIAVSSQAMKGITRKSRIKGLKKANEMLREKIEDLEDFNEKTPNMKKLMHFYQVVEKEIENEYKALKGHQIRLDSKVNEITQVIASQQSYVSAAPLTEKTSLNIIVEDALSMQTEMIEENNITVVKKIKEIPLVRIQKAKFMHILLNLIKNAKDAMLEIPFEERTMTILSECNDNSVFIKVDDTGCGIQDDHIQKIFSHGFTTKKHSQGFGLHNCANHMAEMKGKIWAESDGQGKGARFVLQFSIET